jgi:hypothetical protein
MLTFDKNIKNHYSNAFRVTALILFKRVEISHSQKKENKDPQPTIDYYAPLFFVCENAQLLILITCNLKI